MMRKIEGKKFGGMEGAVPMKSEGVSYPNFYIDTEYLPEAKDWKPGKEYVITLKVRQTGISMRKGRDGKETGHADFDIIGIESKGEAKGKVKRYQ